jgi:hypothetical protein
VSVHPVIDNCHGWERTLDKMIQQLDAEARARARAGVEVSEDELVEAFDARADGNGEESELGS